MIIICLTTRADKPVEKGRVGGHTRAFLSGGKADATEMTRTPTPKARKVEAAHVCVRKRGFLLFVE
jgi:hypothetical protein